jgi:hypothetical protein
MARLKVWQHDQTDKDVVLQVMLESDDGHRFGTVEVTLPKNATPAAIEAAIQDARRSIRDAPTGGVEDIARVIADRINSGDLP